MKALVVGGGIGGLSAAIALARAGIEVDVIERVAVLREVGAGLSLWANAIHALDCIGLGDAVRRFSTPDMAAGIRTWDGRELVRAPIGRLRERFGESAVLVMHRAELQAALVAALGPDRIHLGVACAGVEESSDAARVRCADGSIRDVDVVVGADGLHSVVRAALHGVHGPRYSGYTAWRAIVPFDHGTLQPGESWGAGARFGQVPMAGGLVYWFATSNRPEGQTSPDGEKADVLRTFGRWHQPIPALIEATPAEAVVRNDIYDRPPLRQWGRGRVTLLGDAVHPMTPNLGQGACQAIEDAVVLARHLSQPGVSPDVALRAYERARAPRTAQIVRQSRLVGQVGQWAHPLLVRLRSGLLSRLSDDRQIGQLEPVVGYRV